MFVLVAHDLFHNGALGRIGDVQVAWIQPLTDSGAYARFLAAHGDGVFSLVHRASSPEALTRELERLRALGVGVLQRTEIDVGSGSVILVHMDTEAQGACSLGLVCLPPEIAADSDVPARPLAPKLAHIASIARDIRAVSAFWSKLGFPVVQSGGWGRQGKPGSGRFAYLDTAPLGGLVVELLWSFPQQSR